MRRTSKLTGSFAAVLVVFLVFHLLMKSQLELEDALFLTKNSLKEFQTLYMCKSRRFICPNKDEDKGIGGDAKEELQVRHGVWGMDIDLDSPFSNVMNSVFPVDLIVSYNVSNTTHEFLARYASFSLILNGRLRSEYAIIPGFGCEKLDADQYPDLKEKILIVLRGECTFVKKVTNILDSGLRPRAIAVANNEPFRSLITMYSSTFNEDGLVNVPILFITNEDYEKLLEIQHLHTPLVLQTATIDGWINLMLLMAVSPPLLILLCYMLVRSIQMCHRRRVNRLNQRLVRKLPVYIFGGNHLIPTGKFYDYLTVTEQTHDIPLVLSSSENLPAGQESDVQPSRTSFVINGTDLYSLKDLHLLFADKDYYPTQKCSICLGRFIPLKSRVLVLECKHIYHEKCLSNWLINFRRTCPLCNESLNLLEALPLLATDSSSYGSFGIDLERSSEYSDQGMSTTAVRSLQLDRQLSRTQTLPSIYAVPKSGSGSTKASQSASGTAATIPSATSVESEASFVTTRSHMLDTVSTASQYLTPQNTNGEDTGDETQLDESSMTIRNA